MEELQVLYLERVHQTLLKGKATLKRKFIYYIIEICHTILVICM
jgi:hypothetical protein